MKFELPNLPYEMNALEPHISARTLGFHHGKHHATYVKNLNDLIKGSEFTEMKLPEIIATAHSKPDKAAIFNNAAQAWNHDFYWKSMKAEGGGMPTGELVRKIKDDFGDFENFAQQFKQAGKTQFGSGWAWLVLDRSNNKLKVVKTSNADNPLVRDQVPLMTIDVWEHAYYLDYQNKRPDYIEVFMQYLVNWDFANSNLDNSV
ncbi:superoxide dismutase [Rickettsiales bacterium]|nr:superoxide dismutase [Rickettsiales bacterium]